LKFEYVCAVVSVTSF